ncbi:tigger transposable element-derived protein 2-like [Wyeomyia smithii]|uniref:tigger transposable element-derived protein 2-like n=1 Tax=Wyeomyia smithii TaxID=174621 RepID=UPI002467C68E|nr:tigger transposable element-derived protein 2-like [Wyeomyia smithii]
MPRGVGFLSHDPRWDSPRAVTPATGDSIYHSAEDTGLTSPIESVFTIYYYHLLPCDADQLDKTGSDDLRTADGAISTTFLPPNTTALLQPMDQNIIQMVKSNYRQKLMREILVRPGEFDDKVKHINIKDAIFWVAEAWNAVPAVSISKSWKMLCRGTEFNDEDDVPLSVVKERLKSIQQQLIEQDNTVQEEDLEFDFMNDEEIVNSILHPNTSFYESDDTFSTTQDANASSTMKCAPIDMEEDSRQLVSNESALYGIDAVISWAEENRLPLERQFMLRELRGNIMEKIITSRNANA